ncbi:hypothetical protein [Sandaracinus amylolyticus]|uniref:hypothetical protein n=1 Tax=Sandaracinus amylolyticus TaxID=927083 RepID=UPI001F2AB92F|nr:hypothetical protein [Sandaracinus amylolyticus]UJR84983.1 Hypothetical protein I5071_70620 [Sandaracinus amylolyticus]
MLIRTIAATLVLLAAVGCGDGGVGPEGDVVGGSCTADGACAGGSRCLVESDFPDGTCTVDCTSQDDCPGGSICVQENGGTCLLACEAADDCRDGYACVEKSRLGAPDGALVCMS